MNMLLMKIRYIRNRSVQNGSEYVVLEGSILDPKITSSESSIQKSRKEHADSLSEDGAVVIAYEDAPKLISIAESADAVDEERQEYFKKGELYKFMQVDKYLDMIKPL